MTGDITRRKLCILAVFGASGLLARSPLAAEPAGGPGLVNPFDKDDPQIQAIKKLNWQQIDVSAQELRTQCVSLLALNEVTMRLGAKADARLDLLIDYFNAHNLGEAFAGHMADESSAQPISFEDARKVAVAVVQSQIGGRRVGAAGG